MRQKSVLSSVRCLVRLYWMPLVYDDIIGWTATLVGICPKERYPYSCAVPFVSLSLAVIDPLHARYLIAHKIASGGFGHVYAGVRKKDGMPVALKVVPKPRMTELSTVRCSSAHTEETRRHVCFLSLAVGRQIASRSCSTSSRRQS
jgi:hypothetical protein